MNRINIVDISTFPEGVPLETPLHVKRRRVWSPATGNPRRASLLSSRPNAMVEIKEELPFVAEASSSGSPGSSPSPKMIVACGSSSTASSPVQKPTKGLRPHKTPHKDKSSQLNYGSESESGGESDDDGMIMPVIPRTFRIVLETPKDDDVSADFDLPIATEPATTAATDTEKPTSMFDFEWTSFPDCQISPESRRETFSASNVGPTTPCVDPYDTFIAIWDQQIMEHIASETNRYAQEVTQQMMLYDKLHPTSRICTWHDTNVDELYMLFAILLAMGIVIKSEITEYWNATTDIFCTPGFSIHMSLRRFQLLNKCLHFNNNGDMCRLELDSSEAKLFKIKPVLLHLNRKFQKMYTMRQNIALDESLLQWKGWLEINQFIPNKTAAVGIKTYEICESQTGYLWRLEVHAHKKSAPHHQNPLDGFTPKLVLRLIQGLENKGYTLWMDNFYNSPALARKLKCLGFDCAGTLRTNRQFVPQDLNGLSKRNMRPGQITGFTSGDVDVMVWRDQNCVATISTYHGNAVAHGNNMTIKPILILDYNIMMGGVDKKDQMLAMYPIERKRTRIWYKKFFRRLLNVSVFNAFILVKRSSSNITHRAFRIALIKSLLSKHSSPNTFIAPSKTTFYEAQKHYLAEYPFLPGQSGRQRRLCCRCKKRVHTYCVGCDKPVCMTKCFPALHS